MFVFFATSQRAGDMSDFEEHTYDGTLYNKSGSVYVVYTADGETCSLKQTDGLVKFTRHGSNSTLRFKSGEDYDCFYNTPAGAMEINVKTDSMHGALAAGNTLSIKYTLCLNGTEKIHTNIEIKIEEK